MTMNHRDVDTVDERMGKAPLRIWDFVTPIGSPSQSLRRLVKALAQFLASFEARYVLLIDEDNNAIFRIAPHPRRKSFHGERTEAAQLDAIASGHRRNDFSEHGVDDAFGLALI